MPKAGRTADLEMPRNTKCVGRSPAPQTWETVSILQVASVSAPRLYTLSLQAPAPSTNLLSLSSSREAGIANWRE